jgi:type IV secretion system protein VirD4
VKQAERGRVALGRAGRSLIAVERGQSVVVIGPTQSLKTSGIAIPAILEWDGPLIATSVKTDLVRDTIKWRERVGSVLVYDPAATTGFPRAGWSPLAASTSWPAARRVAASLCSVGRAGGGSGGLEDAGFWYSMAEKLLAPLLFAAASVGATMGDLCRWVDTEETSDVLLALELAGVEEAVRAAAASFAREERQRSSVFATLESVLAAFSDPSVIASTQSNEIVAERLAAGGSGTVYLCAPSHEQERLQPVFVTILRQLLDAAFERAAQAGGPLDPPLLVVLDEAANVAPIAELDRLAATAAGHGVQLVTVFQDLAQIDARYGARAGTVVNNHRAKLVLSGISDPSTLEYMSRLVGDQERWTSSVSVDPQGGWSRTHSPQTRPLAPAAALRRITPGEGVLIYGHLPPARVVLRPWFSDPELRRRA